MRTVLENYVENHLAELTDSNETCVITTITDVKKHVESQVKFNSEFEDEDSELKVLKISSNNANSDTI